MTAIGFQLYSLHGVDDPLPTVVDRIGETAFEGVEFAGLGDATVDELSAALDDAGLGAAGAHVGLEDIEADTEEIADTYRRLGCETITVPWLGAEHFESIDAVRAAGERLDAAAEELADHGLSLHYHNHDQEFVDVDGRPALVALLEATDTVGLQPDLGWIGAAGGDPLAFLDEHADRVDLVHLKDFDAESGEPVEVGEGDLDIAATVDLVREHGFDWLIYEAEDHPDDYRTLDHAHDVVEAYW